MSTDRMLLLGGLAGSPAQQAYGCRTPGGLFGGAVGIISLLCDLNDTAGYMLKTLALCGKMADQSFLGQHAGMTALQ